MREKMFFTEDEGGISPVTLVARYLILVDVLKLKTPD